MRTGIHLGIPRSAHRNNAGGAPAAFVPGDNGEFLVLDSALGITLDTGSNIKIIADQGAGSNNFQQLTELDQPEQIIDDVDYDTTDSIDWDDINTFMETILSKTAWRFMHDGTTEYIIHVVWKPGAVVQHVLSTQANVTTNVGFNLQRSIGNIIFSTSNGTAQVYNGTAAGWVDDDVDLVQIHINPGDVGNEVRIKIADDTEDVTAALGPTPDTGDADRDCAYGSGGGGFTPMLGTTSFLSIQKNPSAQYITNIRTWLADNKGATV